MVYFSSYLTNFFEYNRKFISEGKIWSLFTGHITHWSFSHFFWDTIIFFLLGIKCEQENIKKFLTCLVSGILLISLGIWFLAPNTYFYRGLSGIDSVLFSFIVILFLKKAWQKKNKQEIIVIVIVILLFFFKIIYEMIYNQSFFVVIQNPNITPLSLVHILGFIIGTTIALI